MTKCKVGIYGASGFGKEVLPIVREHLNLSSVAANIYFIDDGSDLSELAGVSVVNYDEFKRLEGEIKGVVIAIADSKIRELLSLKVANDGIKQMSISANNNIIMDDVSMDEGSLLCPFVTLTSNINIGKAFHANIYSYVAHDCVIGDYVTFAPRVMCNGNVQIEDHAYIGTGAIIKQGAPNKPLIIGEGAIVGMGAVVTKNVEPYTIVVGNPAKKLKTIQRP